MPSTAVDAVRYKNSYVSGEGREVLDKMYT